MIRIMTVMDNLAGEQELLHSEPALSFYITIEDKEKDKNKGKLTRLMFDFGAGATALENARLLNVPLKKIDIAIASHGHYDHGNGYPFFVEAGMRCELVTGRGYFCEKYELNGDIAKNVAGYIGVNFDREWLAENNIEHRECVSVMQLSTGLYIIGNIERFSRHDFETIPKKFVLRDHEHGAWVQDMFTDEICLAIDTPKGLIIIVGCSHPGILNIIDTVKARLADFAGLHKPIHAIVGGTHLSRASDERLERTVLELQELRDRDGLSLVAFNHCSGTRVRELMSAAALPAITLRVGDCLFFD